MYYLSFMSVIYYECYVNQYKCYKCMLINIYGMQTIHRRFLSNSPFSIIAALLKVVY